MRQALPYLKRSSAPRIVVESAGCAADPDGSVLPFSTAKGGVEALVKGAARRLARYGITVNAISLAGVPGEGAGEEELAALRGQIPLGRCCTGADLAFAAETLICEEAGFVTGEIFHLSGGLFVN